MPTKPIPEDLTERRAVRGRQRQSGRGKESGVGDQE